VVDAPTGFEDWLPTLLDLADLADRTPRDIDGTSLAPALLGTAAAAEERMLYRELTEGRWQSAIAGRWKAIRRAAGPKRPKEPGPIELYDLATDPSEAVNVASQNPAVVGRMRAILDREHVPHPDWPLPFADAAAVTSRPDAEPHGAREPSEPAAVSRRPSVIVFLADDMRADVIHALGNEAIRTPALGDEQFFAWLGFISSIQPGTVVGMGTIPDCTGLDHDDFIDPGAEIEIRFERLGSLRCRFAEPTAKLLPSRWPLRPGRSPARHKAQRRRRVRSSAGDAAPRQLVSGDVSPSCLSACDARVHRAQCCAPRLDR
jgi:hypothetical protein